MKKILAALLLSQLSYAYASDPISWQLDHDFPANVLTEGGNYTITYTFTNQLPISLVKPLVIEKITQNKSEFSFSDNCSGQQLAPQASCTVAVNLSPNHAGHKAVHLVIAGYSNDRVPLPQQTTQATSNSGVNISATTITALPANMVQNTSAPFRFEFTNLGTQTATGININANIQDFSTTCNSHLAAAQSCQVSGTYVAKTASPNLQTVQSLFQFNQGNSVATSSQTLVSQPSGIVANTLQGLPGVAQLNTAYSLSFQFTNHEAAPVAIDTAAVTVAPAAAPGFNETNNTCPTGGANFAAGASCTITGTFNSNAAGQFDVTATMTPSTPPPAAAATQTSTTVTASAAGRTITFVNQCSFPVWFSLNGANRQNNQVDIPCNQPGVNCPQGSVCNPNAGANGLCFWENYAPNNNNFRLNNGENRDVFIPNTSLAQDNDVFWSGNFSARSGCNGTTCLIAQCQGSGGNASCAAGVGFAQPATQAEITMLNSAADTYDVEVINGMSIPIQMTPNGVVANNYTCGEPGKLTADNNFGACNWNNASVPNNNYYWVSAGGQSCSANEGICSSGQLCGLDIGMNKVCGDFLGYWTANEACNINKTQASEYFQCDTYLNSPFPANTYTLSDLYSCNTPNASQPTLNSCYQDGAENTCCGCANWQTLGLNPAIILPASPITENCKNQSSAWVSSVQNSLAWMKQACPNYYTYPYDDKSSTFTCANGGANTVGYTITFCPGGNSGLPAGINEGRNG